MLSRPGLGWTSLLLLLGMLLVVGLAVADSRPLAVEGQARSGSLVVTMVAAGLIGYLLARSSLGVVVAHGIGAGAGAFLLLSMAGALAAEGGPTAALDGGVLLAQTRELSADLEREIELYLGDAGTPPAILTYIVLGAVCWTTAQFSAFTVYRYQRAGPAVVASGVLLFLNEALPAPGASVGQLPGLALMSSFCALAMLLIVRLQLGAQADQWARRHIQDTAEVGRLFLRTGSLFVAIVIIGATSLTAIARVPAQNVDAGSLGDPLGDLGTELSRWLSVLAVDVRPARDTSFDDRLEIQDTWQQGEGIAFVAEVDGGLRGNYWWLSAFSDFDGRAWRRGDTTEALVPVGQPIDIPVDASAAGPFELTSHVSPRRSSLALGTVVGPAEPRVVDRAVRVRSLGDREGLSEILFGEDLSADDGYTVTSAVHDYRARGGSLTASALRAAGTEYPAWISRYLRVDAGASGARTRAKAAEVQALAAGSGRADPYDLALLLQDQLRELTYQTSIEGSCRSGENVPECLLRIRSGFCQQFASTMVMVLRELQIPARFVNGYLPGAEGTAGRYVVPMQALHAWVEVYFPGTGWVRFDPTPGAQLSRYQQQATALEEGAIPASSGPSGTLPPDEATGSEQPSAEPSTSPSAEGAMAGAGWADPGGLLAAAIIAGGLASVALAAIAGVLIVRLRRLPQADGSLAYRRIVGLAERLGYGPHPSQTEYEYAASLSQTLPSVREELYMVAHARVEKRYGNRDVSAEHRPALRRAYARIRTALLRLTWRSSA